ncbi:alpha/beta fold hydrolase [Aquihabitans daechungensis]|uniref:alpha/beta fold hydrolase n=1 Tax=Aquihabitans daechungensis TaxID=1052257 RepID=UPI003BA0CA5D
MPIAPANGIDIAYETFGDPADPTILLIMGLGAQRVMWDDGVCALLVARGLHVVRFDNRDVGQSTWIDAPGLDIGTAVMEVLSGDTSNVPYLLSDMAADAVGLLDHLGIESAHLMGASMGGMIAQTIAIEHPARVLTLTSIMSNTGEPGYGEPSPELATVLLAPRPTDREGIIESGIAIQRAIASEHFDEVRTRAVVELSYEQGFNPDGVGHQLLATLASAPGPKAWRGWTCLRSSSTVARTSSSASAAASARRSSSPVPTSWRSTTWPTTSRGSTGPNAPTRYPRSSTAPPEQEI